MSNSRERRLDRRRAQQQVQQAHGENPLRREAHLQVSESRAVLSISPLPSPEELAKYQQVDPALLPHLLEVVAQQNAHRMGLEIEAQKASFTLARRAQMCALTIGLAGLGTVVALGFFGLSTAASIVGAIDLLGLVAAFLRGSSAKPPPGQHRLSRQPGEDPRA